MDNRSFALITIVCGLVNDNRMQFLVIYKFNIFCATCRWMLSWILPSTTLKITGK